jgi:hypothetical protein
VSNAACHRLGGDQDCFHYQQSATATASIFPVYPQRIEAFLKGTLNHRGRRTRRGAHSLPALERLAPRVDLSTFRVNTTLDTNPSPPTW